MLRSMTGFGRDACDSATGEISWELRSVNHRYLEVSLRVPEELRSIEPAARAAIAASISRGKVEANLKIRPIEGSAQAITLNADVLHALKGAIAHVESTLGETTPVNPLEVMQWPGVIASEKQNQEQLSADVLASLAEAVKDLVATREREGEKTVGFLSERAQSISELLENLKQHRPSVVERQRTKLLARLAELDIEHDAQRVEQELVMAAQKLDIDEELDRLSAHVAEFEKVLKRSGPVGRRLDFLMQEFNREANTIGSKAGDLDTTGASVDIKVLIEQMREQVQNVE